LQGVDDQNLCLQFPNVTGIFNSFLILTCLLQFSMLSLSLNRIYTRPFPVFFILHLARNHMQSSRFRHTIPRRRITLEPTIRAFIHLILSLQARNQHHGFAPVVVIHCVHGATCIDALLERVCEDAGDVVVQDVFADGGSVDFAVPVFKTAGVFAADCGYVSGACWLDECGGCD
jgi:hypothetical protein